MKLQDWFDYWWNVHSHHVGEGVTNVVDRSIAISMRSLIGVEDILSEAFNAARNYEYRASHKYLISESVLRDIVIIRFNVIQANRCR